MPTRLIEYMLCKEFGWTIHEVRKQPYQDVQDFLAIMKIERSEKNRHARSKN